jgi:microcystin-dependent protein
MVGYTRQDTANNIANGNVIDADDLDSEFNAVEDAFNTTSGHSHDGTAGQGAAISKVGPSQDLIVGTTTVLPKSNNIMDLGSQAAQFKNAWFDGTVSTDALIVGNNSYTNISNNEYDVTTGGLTFDVAGDITLDADGGDVILKDGGVTYGSLKGVSNELSIFSGTTEAVTLTGADAVIQGDLDVTTNATVGGTMSVTGNMTIPTANLTLNSGNVVIGGTLGVTGLITGTISTLSNHTTSGLTEGTNLYYTTARATTDAKAAISVTDAGGDGSVTYSAGTITYTGPSAAETRAHFSAGTGVAYSGGQFSIGQAVGTSSNVTFNNATVNGNLTVSGTTTYINTQTLNIGDNIITLNADETGTPSADAGIEVERGNLSNKSFIWDESEDEWSVGSERIKAGTFEGGLTGNASTATKLATARTITLTGDVSGSTTFDGSANISIDAVVAAQGAFMPSGGIIMWSGSLAAIPSGWFLCNGSNGTPDLRDRMVIGAGSSYAVGATGGSTTSTIDTQNLPSHTHSFNTTTNTTGNHSHTGTTNTTGAHTHTFSGGGNNYSGVSTSSSNGGTVTTNSAGNHSHTVTTNTTGNHSHTVSGTTDGTGNGSAFATVSPYYALAYIMKS